MNPQEKAAWYTLVVAGLMLSTFISLLILTRNPWGSQAAFALMALWAFSGLFATGKKGKVSGDEHDQLINLKAGRAAFVVFWLFFVAYGMLAMHFGSSDGMMHSYWMSTFLGLGLCVLLGSQAVATLIYYRADTTEKLTWTDRLRRTGDLRKSGLVMTGIFLFVATPFSLMMIFVGDDELPTGFAFLQCATFAVLYLLERVMLRRVVKDGAQQHQLRRSERASTFAIVLAAFAGAAGVLVNWFVSSGIALSSMIPRVIFFVLVAGILSLSLGLVRYGGRDEGAILQLESDSDSPL